MDGKKSYGPTFLVDSHSVLFHIYNYDNSGGGNVQLCPFINLSLGTQTFIRPRASPCSPAQPANT